MIVSPTVGSGREEEVDAPLGRRKKGVGRSLRLDNTPTYVLDGSQRSKASDGVVFCGIGHETQLLSFKIFLIIAPKNGVVNIFRELFAKNRLAI